MKSLLIALALLFASEGLATKRLYMSATCFELPNNTSGFICRFTSSSFDTKFCMTRISDGEKINSIETDCKLFIKLNTAYRAKAKARIMGK